MHLVIVCNKLNKIFAVKKLNHKINCTLWRIVSIKEEKSNLVNIYFMRKLKLNLKMYVRFNIFGVLVFKVRYKHMKILDGFLKSETSWKFVTVETFLFTYFAIPGFKPHTDWET